MFVVRRHVLVFCCLDPSASCCWRVFCLDLTGHAYKSSVTLSVGGFQSPCKCSIYGQVKLLTTYLATGGSLPSVVSACAFPGWF